MLEISTQKMQRTDALFIESEIFQLEINLKVLKTFLILKTCLHHQYRNNHNNWLIHQWWPLIQKDIW